MDSKKMDREEKLRIVDILLAGSPWAWLKSEYENQCKFLEPTINKKNDDYTQGVLAGIKWCMEFPEKAKKENESYLKRVLNKVYGEVVNGR